VPGLSALLPGQMLNMYFAFLLVMLFFGNIVVGYASLFRNAETGWLMTLPIRHFDLYRWKFAEAMVLSSWAFLFLSAPLMAAYGVVRDVNWFFYVKIAALYLPFIVIPAVCGSWAVLLLSRYLHRRVFKIAVLLICAGGLVAAYLVMKPTDVERLSNSQYEQLFHELMQNTRFASLQVLPSYWMTQSVLALGEGAGAAARFYFLVLLSTAMMAGLMCFNVASNCFYSGWAAVHGRGPLSARSRWLSPLNETAPVRPRTRSWTDRLVHLLKWIKQPTRALVIKDIKTFWRDTTQWSQFVIFFGLLALYILNLRNIKYDKDSLLWMVSFLNLAACSMTLATLTTRFVFPQFSLEGKRLWLVGMAPLGLKKVLMEKFWLSTIASTTITMSLILTSCLMLRLEVRMIAFFLATAVCMSVALSGMAVGLGALYANFKADNPAKIVSGFGGTFCLVLSLIYIVGILGFEAFIQVLFWKRSLTGATAPLDHWLMLAANLCALIIVALISWLIAAIPMRLAFRKMQTLEI
jgi:ABC-2 type transport system permease protein